MLIIICSVLAALLALICVFAFSRNSSVSVRWTARAALLLIILSAGVCLFIILTMPAARAELLAGDIPAEEPAAAVVKDMTVVVIFAVIFAALVALVLFLSFLEKRKRAAMRRPVS